MNELEERFGFRVPSGYDELLRRDLIGFTAETSHLKPWHYVAAGQAFDALVTWPRRNDTNRALDGRLVAFARRVDDDELACLHVLGDHVRSIVCIEGWQARGHEFHVLGTYPAFWGWVKHVIDDVAAWSEEAANRTD
jgi:hypothetical protein